MTVGFLPGTESPARILDDVNELQGRGVLRLLDAVMLAKTADGNLEKLEAGENDFGDLIEQVTDLDLESLFGLMDDDDAAALESAQALAPGAAIAVLLVEHRWAAPLFDTIAAQDGIYLGDGFVSDAAQTLLDRQIRAFDDAANAVADAGDIEMQAAAQAAAATAAADATVAQADAVTAIAAVAAADADFAVAQADAVTAQAAAATVAAQDSIAQADAISAAAAQRAVDALVAAGIIESAAADEAVDAISAAAVAIDAAQQDVAQARTAASVNAGELRVLTLLPTPMTFAVIAAKLGISRSAAKERAERMYKKLGVHNRADAVTRARELKLLPKNVAKAGKASK